MSNDDGVRILFATDGSAGAAVALDLLASLPLRPTDEVLVASYPAFFLVARPGDGGLVTGGLIGKLMDRRRRQAREVVDGALARFVAKGMRASGIVQDGEDAVDAVLRAVRERAVDLVVVGSRGLGPLSSLVIGSTARALAMMSPVPVLVVRERRTAPQRVLVAVDGSEASRASLALLARLPLPDDATIELLHVLPPRQWHEIGPGMDGEIADLREAMDREDADAGARVLREAAEALPPGRTSRSSAERGPVSDTILARAVAVGADLIVVGSRGLGGPRRAFWGSTAERVMVAARCPVLVAPAPMEAARHAAEPAERQGIRRDG